ncbi:MAG: hypothetical protein JRN68_04100 [Nitrososphaerota archaeon]|nr:hypothetical protein [Nitrososphaerota archaeon]
MILVRILGHLTFDLIKVDGGIEYQSLGGPPAYAGLYLANCGASVTVNTKVGPDFGARQLGLLRKRGLHFEHPFRGHKATTRFEIQVNRATGARALRLLNACDGIIADLPKGVKADATIIAPVIGEIDPKDIPRLGSSHFVYVDPQGFLRVVRHQKVTLQPNPALASHLLEVDAIKVDRDEGYVMTGKREPKEIAASLMKLGVKEVLVTLGGDSVLLFYRGQTFSAPVPAAKPIDSIGAGDILGAAYTLHRLFENPERSVLAAVSDVSHLIQGKGISKVMNRRSFVPIIKGLPQLRRGLKKHSG